MQDGRVLVTVVREAAEKHNVMWSMLVPSPDKVNDWAEPIEEAAFQELAAAKHELRQHICETYGISATELASLAIV
jgi:hypothetical protein